MLFLSINSGSFTSPIKAGDERRKDMLGVSKSVTVTGAFVGIGATVGIGASFGVGATVSTDATVGNGAADECFCVRNSGADVGIDAVVVIGAVVGTGTVVGIGDVVGIGAVVGFVESLSCVGNSAVVSWED